MIFTANRAFLRVLHHYSLPETIPRLKFYKDAISEPSTSSAIFTTIRYYSYKSKPGKQESSVWTDLKERTFKFANTRYILTLTEGKKEIFIRIREFHMILNYKRAMFIGIQPAYELLKIIKKGERHMKEHDNYLIPKLRPFQVLFKEKFPTIFSTSGDDEMFTVTVKAVDHGQSDFGNTELEIIQENMKTGKGTRIVIYSHGVPWFRERFEKILADYQYDYNKTLDKEKLPFNIFRSYEKKQIAKASKTIIEEKEDLSKQK